MAVSTIKQSGASPAGDFTSIASWEAAKQADITGLGPEEAECYGFVDNSRMAVAGWTTTAVDYIRIYGAPTADGGEEAGIHDGRSRDVSGTGYQVTQNGLSTVLVGEDFLRIEDIDIKQLSTTAGTAISGTGSFIATADIRLTNCIVHSHTTAITSSNIIQQNRTNEFTTITNCIVYGNSRGVSFDVACIILNTTIYCAGLFGLISSGVISTVENCYVGGATTNYLLLTPNGDYNIASDTSATTYFANGADSKAAGDQFVNASLGSSADFTPKAGADIIAFAPRLGSVLTDIIGASRLDPTTIGAWEFTEAPSVTANPVASLLGL